MTRFVTYLVSTLGATIFHFLGTGAVTGLLKYENSLKAATLSVATPIITNVTSGFYEYVREKRGYDKEREELYS